MSAKEPLSISGVGLRFGVLSHVSWGLAPLFWRLFAEVKPGELLAHRLLWGFCTFLAIAFFAGRLAEFSAMLRSWRIIRMALLSGALIATNWLAFLYAIYTERVLHVSLGYFINPLVMVLLGLVFLKERLRGAQWIAVGLAASGVMMYVVATGTLPWISLVVAFSFGFYGLVRKTMKLDALLGSLTEMSMTSLAALGYLFWLSSDGGGELGNVGPADHLLLLSTGIVTAVPLFWYASAARRLPLYSMGFLQYITPSTHFLLAVLLWREPFQIEELAAFIAIWLALALFSIDSLRNARRPR